MKLSIIAVVIAALLGLTFPLIYSVYFRKTNGVGAEAAADLHRLKAAATLSLSGPTPQGPRSLRTTQQSPKNASPADELKLASPGQTDDGAVADFETPPPKQVGTTPAVPAASNPSAPEATTSTTTAAIEPLAIETSLPSETSERADEERDSCNFRSLRIGTGPPSEFKVSNYIPTFQLCTRNDALGKKVAVRSMSIGGEGWLLLADRDDLKTSLEKVACWKCEATTDEALQDTRLVQSVIRASQMPGVEHRTFLQNAGLRRGASSGDFVTGDLCPSNRPLDRRFFELLLSSTNGPAPIALSISGLWLENHEADFRWLQRLESEGRLDIVWVNHSYTHPFARGQSFDHTFMMTRNLNPDFEILETERLLISRGGVPSVFFRFPGLISSSPLMQRLRDYHLIPLGAEAWLAKGERPHHGSIILVHPNGNEEAGLDQFEKLYRDGSVSRPLEPITAAPERTTSNSSSQVSRPPEPITAAP